MSDAMVDRWVAHAPVKVWRALTEPALAARWLPFEGYQAVVGHRFTAAGPTGRAQCKVVAVEPPMRVTLAWSETGQPVSTVWVELIEEGGGTRVSVRHEGLPEASSRRLHSFWLTALSSSLDGVLVSTAVAPAGVAGVGLAVFGGFGVVGLAAVAVALWWLSPAPHPGEAPGVDGAVAVQTPVEAEAPQPSSERAVRPPVREPESGGRRSAAAAPVGSLELSSDVVYEREMPTTVHPLYPKTDVDRRTQRLIYDPLFTRSAITSELRSEVLSSVEVRGERLRVTVLDGLRFHDGHVATAEDVCFSVRTVLDPQLPSSLPFRRRGDLVGCEVVSASVADLVFRQVFPDAQARAAVPLLPAHAFEPLPDGEPSVRPIGTGPYRAVRGRRSVKLSAFDNPHHRAQMREFSLAEGGDPLVQVRTLLSGSVAGIVDVPPANRPEISASDHIALKSFDRRAVTYVAMDGAQLPIDVRRAVRDALDREDLCRLTQPMDAIQSGCEGTTGPFVPSSPFYNRSIRPQSSQEQVGKHMAAAGAVLVGGRWQLGGEPVALRLGASEEVPGYRHLQQAISNQLVTAGFVVERATATAGQDPTVWIGEHAFDLADDPTDLVAQTRYGSPSAAVTALLQRMDDATTDTEQQDAAHDLHAQMFSEAQVVSILKVDTKSGWHMGVRNNVITPVDYWGEVDGWQVKPAEAVEPTTDGACLDLHALEPAAGRGELSEASVQCLRRSAERSHTHRWRASKILLTHAFAAGNMDLWEDVAILHLEQIDPNDAQLAYQLALRLSVGGLGRSEKAIHWADAALALRGAWSGERYRSRVAALHKLRTEAAYALWRSAGLRHTRSPSSRSADLTQTRGARTLRFAREWREVAEAAGQDAFGAQQLCLDVADQPSSCMPTAG